MQFASFLRFLDPTQIDTQPGRTAMWWAYRRGCYLHNTQQTQGMNVLALNRFQTHNPTFEQPQTYALDYTATQFIN